MKTAVIAALAAALLLAACDQTPKPASRTDAQGNTITEWTPPAGPGSAQPDLFLAPDGRLLLSWIKPFDGPSDNNGRRSLQFSSFNRQDQWQWAPKTIAVGGSMIANWADTPHIAATADGAVWAHWLQRTRSAASAGSSDGDEDASYDIIAAQSSDDGMHWGTPIRVHNDGQAVEHGFVSFWPAARDRIGIAWLDGRHTVDAGGMTSLHTATMTNEPRMLGDDEVDATVCDCCGTDVAMTSSGPLLVYRDRTADEIRDIYAARRGEDGWRTPTAVHADGWRMTACPVNGPRVAAQGSNAVVAWYTAASGQPTLNLAYSNNAGDTFAAPVAVDRGDAVQGRTDVALDANTAWVAWLREDASGQSLWLTRYAPDLSRELSRVEVAKLSAHGRGTGFPKLAVRGGEAFLVWTDSVGGVPQLHGARVSNR